MNILFYIEPLIFHSNPFYYGSWMRTDLNFIRLIYGQSRDGDFRIVLNKPLADRCLQMGIPQENVISIEQFDLRNIFNCANMDIIKKFHHKKFTKTESNQLKDLYKEKCGDFEPDIILSWSPISFFESIFPDAVLMHKENGPLSRLPYPYTTYFDPLGMYEHSMLGVFHKELQAKKANKKDLEFLCQLTAPYEKILLAKNPFDYLIKNLRSRFDKLLLLPLQTSHTIYFDINGPFQTQGEFLFDVIENTPEDTAIIVTTHDLGSQVGDRFHEELLHYFMNVKKNVIIDNHIQAVHYATQYLLPFVDVCVGVSSSVSVQSLLWKTPLVTFGHSHLSYFSSAPDLQTFWKLSKEEVTYFEGALAWMFQHYFLLDTYAVRDKGWVYDFFRRAVQKKKEGLLNLSFYRPIDEPKKLIKQYHHTNRVIKREQIPSFVGQFLQVVGTPFEGSLYESNISEKNNIMNGCFVPGNKTDKENEIVPHWCLYSGQERAQFEFLSFRNEQSKIDIEPNIEHYLHLKVNTASPSPVCLVQKIKGLGVLLGKKITITFWARGLSGSFFNIRCNSSTALGVVKTKAAMVILEEKWKRFSITLRIDELININVMPHDSLDFNVEVNEVADGFFLDITGVVITKSEMIVPVDSFELINAHKVDNKQKCLT